MRFDSISVLSLDNWKPRGLLKKLSIGDCGGWSLWGSTELRPIARVFALDNGTPSPEHVFAERLFDFFDLWNFHAISPFLLDILIIT